METESSQSKWPECPTCGFRLQHIFAFLKEARDYYRFQDFYDVTHVRRIVNAMEGLTALTKDRTNWDCHGRYGDYHLYPTGNPHRRDPMLKAPGFDPRHIYMLTKVAQDHYQFEGHDSIGEWARIVEVMEKLPSMAVRHRSLGYDLHPTGPSERAEPKPIAGRDPNQHWKRPHEDWTRDGEDAHMAGKRYRRGSDEASTSTEDPRLANYRSPGPFYAPRNWLYAYNVDGETVSNGLGILPPPGLRCSNYLAITPMSELGHVVTSNGAGMRPPGFEGVVPSNGTGLHTPRGLVVAGACPPSGLNGASSSRTESSSSRAETHPSPGFYGWPGQQNGTYARPATGNFPRPTGEKVGARFANNPRLVSNAADRGNSTWTLPSWANGALHEPQVTPAISGLPHACRHRDFHAAAWRTRERSSRPVMDGEEDRVEMHGHGDGVGPVMKRVAAGEPMRRERTARIENAGERVSSAGLEEEWMRIARDALFPRADIWGAELIRGNNRVSAKPRRYTTPPPPDVGRDGEQRRGRS